jgi:hypothetical protein
MPTYENCLPQLALHVSIRFVFAKLGALNTHLAIYKTVSTNKRNA